MIDDHPQLWGMFIQLLTWHMAHMIICENKLGYLTMGYSQCYDIIYIYTVYTYNIIQFGLITGDTHWYPRSCFHFQRERDDQQKPDKSSSPIGAFNPSQYFVRQFPHVSTIPAWNQTNPKKCTNRSPSSLGFPQPFKCFSDLHPT